MALREVLHLRSGEIDALSTVADLAGHCGVHEETARRYLVQAGIAPLRAMSRRKGMERQPEPSLEYAWLLGVLATGGSRVTVSRLAAPDDYSRWAGWSPLSACALQ